VDLDPQVRSSGRVNGRHPSARLDLRSGLASDWSTIEVGINSLVL